MTTTALVETKPAATLVKVGNRDRSLVGWKYAAVEAHLFDTHIQKGTWCDVGCLAHTCFSRDTAANRKAVRQRLRAVARQMITRHRFLVVEYAPNGSGTHGEAHRFKIYEGADEDERQAAVLQLDRMRQRREITETNYEAAKKILRVVTSVELGAVHA